MKTNKKFYDKFNIKNNKCYNLKRNNNLNYNIKDNNGRPIK